MESPTADYRFYTKNARDAMKSYMRRKIGSLEKSVQSQINAGHEPLPEAGATQERTL